jgi:uncharacterized protein YjiS (DUF1127 family)
MTASSYQPPTPPHPSDDSASLPRLVGALTSPNWIARHDARRRLAELGDRAIPSVRVLLDDPREQVRWEAAKTLSDLGSPRAAPSLVKALTDEDSFGVRWVAAEGLVKLGAAGLEPLLVQLVEHPRSIYLRVGAHHVLYELRRRGDASYLDSVLAALGSFSPRVELPFVAREALADLRRRQSDLVA